MTMVLPAVISTEAQRSGEIFENRLFLITRFLGDARNDGAKTLYLRNKLLFINLTIAAAPSFSTRATAVGRAQTPMKY
ncbi:hypothetical protein D7004_02585 [Pedobacter jejuensis]|uniref:Uncharacterized protein n=1 Tax=Pedobacter jejuensis TaxID=1268550 RepID=A0A3N0C1P0_9SPHI|nr:hypothetical protein D7004_02585 [Pedobacter jejuensis]